MNLLMDFPTTSSKHSAIVTIGNFDGCHRGHQHLFKHCFKHGMADRRHQKIAITFNSPDREQLFSYEQKHQALAEYGFDTCIIKDLDAKFASISHQDFLYDYLLDKLNMKVIVTGKDFLFGHNRLGHANYLQAEQARGKFTFTSVELALAGETRISSSNIRRLLRSGDIIRANAMLGYKYALDGVVVKGMQRGREINTPTLNLSVDNFRVVPKSGVYIGIASLNASSYTCVINIGTRPTMSATSGSAASGSAAGEVEEVIEAHVIDTQLPNLYGNKLKLAFHRRLRQEIKFPSIQNLKHQIQQDIQAARQYGQ